MYKGYFGRGNRFCVGKQNGNKREVITHILLSKDCIYCRGERPATPKRKTEK